jgi:hypothetical protein
MNALKQRLQTLRETVTMEHVLLVFFLVTAVYFFVESYSYSERASAFPRFTAGATIVGVTLLLLRSYLPGPLGRLVTDSGGTFEDAVDDAESLGADPETDDSNQPNAPTPGAGGDQTDSTSETALIRSDPPEPESEVTYVDLRGVWINGTAFTALLTAVYVVLGYVIGLLWASPLFVAAYLVALGRPLAITAALSAVAFLAGIAFYVFLGIGIATGAVFDFAPFLDPVLDLALYSPTGVIGDVLGGVGR